MTKEEARTILLMHIGMCGALMPIDWLRNNGEGSKTMEAFNMALEALKEGGDSE